MFSKRFISALVLLAVVGTATDGYAQTKMDSALSDAGIAGKKPRVIVRSREGASDSVRSRFDKNGKKSRNHASIGAFSMEAKGKDLEELAKDPDVLGLSLDAEVKGAQVVSQTGSTGVDAQKLRAMLGVPAGLTGKNVGVVVIDSGVASTPDVPVAVAVDFTQGTTPKTVTPSDGYGHGTHVAGLIAGNGTLSNGKYVGVAPGVRLYSFKVLDSNGSGYTSDVIEALDLAVQYKRRVGIDIINLSLGHPIYEPAATDPLVQAVERAVRAGIVVIASAGQPRDEPRTRARLGTRASRRRATRRRR